MDRFLDCLCDENLKALIIDGNATEDELKETWLLILSEYYEIKGDSIDGVEQWKLGRDITKINNHLLLLQQCIDFLKDKYSDSVAESLRRLGYSFNPVVKDPSQYRNLLQVIVNKSKTKYIHLQQLIKQLEKILATITDKKPKRNYFEGLIIQIEEMQGCTYNMEEMMVSKFVMLEKKYWKQVEFMEMKKHKK